VKDQNIDSQKIALITGASSGLGSAYAKHLAMQGYALLLTARRKERLDALALNLQQQYHCLCEVIQADLSQPEDIEALAQRICALPRLDLLINNAGFGLQGPFVKSDPTRETDMIHLHVLATNRLCQAALPIMMRQNSGAIINVASVAGLMLTPHHVSYDATKGYIILFSEALAEECQPYGIHIQALCPGYTRTEFHQNPAYKNFNIDGVPQFLWMNPENLVEKSLAALPRKKICYVPGTLNQCLVWLFRQRWLKFIIWPVYRRLTKK
jgi:hypothetical protein